MRVRTEFVLWIGVHAQAQPPAEQERRNLGLAERDTLRRLNTPTLFVLPCVCGSGEDVRHEG